MFNFIMGILWMIAAAVHIILLNEHTNGLICIAISTLFFLSKEE